MEGHDNHGLSISAVLLKLNGSAYFLHTKYNRQGDVTLAWPAVSVLSSFR